MTGLKQAAQLLLKLPRPEKPAKTLAAEPPQTTVQIEISLEQARTTQWPLPPFKGQPMGTLVEMRQLSSRTWATRLKRLGGTGEESSQGFDAGKANQTIQEPAPSAGFVKVIAGRRSYADRKQLQLSLIQGLIMGAMLGAMAVWAIQYNVQHPLTHAGKAWSEAFTSPVGIVVLVIGVLLLCLVWVGLTLFDRLVIRKLDKKIENYSEGEKGEERVVEVIIQALDGNWSFSGMSSYPGAAKPT